MATATQWTLLLSLLTSAFVTRCDSDQEVGSMSEEDDYLGSRRTSYRAQEQRAIFDLIVGILETLQTTNRREIERARRDERRQAARQTNSHSGISQDAEDLHWSEERTSVDLGSGRTSYRAQEQRAIFDLIVGILETLQAYNKEQQQIYRARRKQRRQRSRPPTSDPGRSESAT